MAFGDYFAQSTHNARLDLRVHGQVRLFPFTHHPKADEIGLLAGDLFGSVITTGLTEGLVIHLHTRLANLLLHLVLNW